MIISKFLITVPILTQLFFFCSLSFYNAFFALFIDKVNNSKMYNPNQFSGVMLQEEGLRVEQ